MRKTWLLIGSLAVIVACNGDPDPAPAGPFTIGGTVTIINDCDRQIDSIPNKITVKADLSNAAGDVVKPGSTEVELVPAPGGGPAKTRAYIFTVQWPGGFAGEPANWGNFTETLVGGDDICGSIKCETKTCKNLATRERTLPVGRPTKNDIRIRCACSD